MKYTQVYSQKYLQSIYNSPPEESSTGSFKKSSVKINGRWVWCPAVALCGVNKQPDSEIKRGSLVQGSTNIRPDGFIGTVLSVYVSAQSGLYREMVALAVEDPPARYDKHLKSAVVCIPIEKVSLLKSKFLEKAENTLKEYFTDVINSLQNPSFKSANRRDFQYRAVEDHLMQTINSIIELRDAVILERKNQEGLDS